MKMSRKTFVGLLLAALAAAWSARIAPTSARVWRALRARVFPGRVQPLDERAMRQRGRWIG